mmetsp:Transcript_26086/g.37092  ORF Transcript_26086/g.37092 Transcript_26086/m.37092 type:complete len:95 (+) Transcript_26086:93-377(+)
MDAMIQCGVPDGNPQNGQTKAQQIALGLFRNSFTTSMQKTTEDLRAGFKHYATLTVANGRITLDSNIKENIQAFMQWCRDEIRMGSTTILSHRC